MRTLLCFSAGLIALSLTNVAFGQGGAPTPVYRDWMPPPTPGAPGAQSTSPGSTTTPSSTSSSSSSSSSSTTAAKPAADSTSVTMSTADKPQEAAPPRREDPDGPWHMGVDAVIGFGSTPVINQRLVGPLLGDETRTATQARFNTESVNLDLSYAVLDHLRLGLMLPVGGGTLFPSDASRSNSVVGNLTVTSVFKARLSRDVDFVGGLDVALPTAVGDEPPPADQLATEHLNQPDQDRHSLLHAMSDSRGREDTAGYAPDHLGLVPKLGVVWKIGSNGEIEPYAKYSSLHPTATASSYEGSVVIAGRFTYRFSEYLDGTVRVWTNIPVAKGNTDDNTVAIAEPQFRGHFGGVMPILGVVLPFAGQLKDPYTIGVRASLLARF